MTRPNQHRRSTHGTERIEIEERESIPKFCAELIAHFEELRKEDVSRAHAWVVQTLREIAGQ